MGVRQLMLADLIMELAKYVAMWPRLPSLHPGIAQCWRPRPWRS